MENVECPFCKSQNTQKTKSESNFCNYCCSFFVKDPEIRKFGPEIDSYLQSLSASNILLIGFEFNEKCMPIANKSITYVDGFLRESALRAGLKFGKFDLVCIASTCVEPINFQAIKPYLQDDCKAIVAYFKNSESNPTNQSIFIIDKMLRKDGLSLADNINEVADNLFIIEICGGDRESGRAQEIFDKEIASL